MKVRNRNIEFLEDKANELGTNSKDKNSGYLYRDINTF
jgi:hypothetical protein